MKKINYMNKLILFFVCTMLIACNSEKRVGDLNEGGISEKRVGDLYEGGIIVHLYKDGGGIIMSQKNLGKMEWSDAVEACERLTIDGYTDWYLPSVEQLRMLYPLKDSVSPLKEQTKEVKETLEIESHTYWSSEESTNYYDHTYKEAVYVRFRDDFPESLVALQRWRIYVVALRDF